MPARRHTDIGEPKEGQAKPQSQKQNQTMIIKEKPFTFRFVEAENNVVLELTNGTDRTLKCIEVLTVLLKDEITPGGGPSQAHIRFDAVERILPTEKSIMPHRTWINGKPVATERDLLERLKVIVGEPHPYVLDISWQDTDGKTRFQRIPVGHLLHSAV
jgi:hypothetical protein